MVIIHSFEIIKTIPSNKSTHTQEKTHDTVKKNTRRSIGPATKKTTSNNIYNDVAIYVYYTRKRANKCAQHHTLELASKHLGSMLNAAQARRCCMCVVFSTPPQNNSMANYVCNLCKLCSILNWMVVCVLGARASGSGRIGNSPYFICYFPDFVVDINVVVNFLYCWCRRTHGSIYLCVCVRAFDCLCHIPE